MNVVSTEASLRRLADLLVSTGQCDARAVERARRVADDVAQRLDTSLLQLGLVSERGLAEAYAALLDLPLTEADRYPAAPLPCTAQLTARFLRQARALPVALEDGLLVVTLADPLDSFTPAAIATVTGQRTRTEVAVPIELKRR